MKPHGIPVSLLRPAHGVSWPCHGAFLGCHGAPSCEFVRLRAFSWVPVAFPDTADMCHAINDFHDKFMADSLQKAALDAAKAVTWDCRGTAMRGPWDCHETSAGMYMGMAQE